MGIANSFESSTADRLVARTRRRRRRSPPRRARRACACRVVGELNVLAFGRIVGASWVLCERHERVPIGHRTNDGICEHWDMSAALSAAASTGSGNTRSATLRVLATSRASKLPVFLSAVTLRVYRADHETPA